jgi:isopentenyl-diphosphate Delta-isomerase
MEEQVVLVDERDNPIGVDGKMAVHRSGKLHRAISIFIFDDDNRLLLQQRASSKYHSGGLWSNTCCSHPRPEEDSSSAARRRLREEMGIECELWQAFSFLYQARLANRLIEHEYDHVFFGRYDGVPVLNRDEADDWRWVALAKLSADVKRNPNAYSFWLAVCLDQVVAYRADQRLPHAQHSME